MKSEYVISYKSLLGSRLIKDSSINFGLFRDNFIVSLLSNHVLFTAKCALLDT